MRSKKGAISLAILLMITLVFSMILGTMRLTLHYHELAVARVHFQQQESIVRGLFQYAWRVYQLHKASFELLVPISEKVESRVIATARKDVLSITIILIEQGKESRVFIKKFPVTE